MISAQICSSSMATFVPCASFYARNSVQPLYLFGKRPRGASYRPLGTNWGPRCAPGACRAPSMTLRQICHTLKVMKQVRKREAAASAAVATATTSRKPGSAAPPSPGADSEKKCVPSCFRRKRSLKRVG